MSTTTNKDLGEETFKVLNVSVTKIPVFCFCSYIQRSKDHGDVNDGNANSAAAADHDDDDKDKKFDYNQKSIQHLYKCTVTARIDKKIRSLSCIYRRRGGDTKVVIKVLKPYLIRKLKANKDLR